MAMLAQKQFFDLVQTFITVLQLYILFPSVGEGSPNQSTSTFFSSPLNMVSPAAF